jgi:hypothetical protein
MYGTDYAGSKSPEQLEATCRGHLAEIDQLEGNLEAKAQLRNTVYSLFGSACART